MAILTSKGEEELYEMLHKHSEACVVLLESAIPQAADEDTKKMMQMLLIIARGWNNAVCVALEGGEE